ncbi:unnamed protein product [Microthlaspi erraticum]|uniref:Uncharacterized protein n=1 Tax=Microthlaspi erraticum TaxID=1685480 RepID=A0A6D2K6W7_9BRAS|nr:unnamed protein product [Microthlaspi erraticum]
MELLTRSPLLTTLKLVDKSKSQTENSRAYFRITAEPTYQFGKQRPAVGQTKSRSQSRARPYRANRKALPCGRVARLMYRGRSRHPTRKASSLVFQLKNYKISRNVAISNHDWNIHNNTNRAANR